MRSARCVFAIVVAAGLALGVFAPAGPAAARNWRPRDTIEGNDHDAARAGVRRGQLVPLGRVIGTVRARYPGQLLDASLHELVPGQPVYRVLILTRDGRRLAIWVDAQTGRIIRTEG